jgi:hypothetical protein
MKGNDMGASVRERMLEQAETADMLVMSIRKSTALLTQGAAVIMQHETLLQQWMTTGDGKSERFGDVLRSRTDGVRIIRDLLALCQPENAEDEAEGRDPDAWEDSYVGRPSAEYTAYWSAIDAARAYLETK